MVVVSVPWDKLLYYLDSANLPLLASTGEVDEIS